MRGGKIKKVKAKFTAGSANAACDVAYANMNVNASLGVCEVGSGRGGPNLASCMFA
jgi:hypothetical protein